MSLFKHFANLPDEIRSSALALKNSFLFLEGERPLVYGEYRKLSYDLIRSIEKNSCLKKIKKSEYEDVLCKYLEEYSYEIDIANFKVFLGFFERNFVNNEYSFLILDELYYPFEEIFYNHVVTLLGAV